MPNSNNLKLKPINALSLARNTSLAISGQQLANPKKWTHLNHNAHYIWGNITTQNIQTVVQLHTGRTGIACSCTQKQPCNHSLGLLMLFTEQPDTFMHSKMPDSIAKMLQTSIMTVDNIRADVERGISQLEQWLINLMRQGLGESQVREYAFWENMAQRMVAARMPVVAQRLREIGLRSKKTSYWVEETLEYLSLLYLLVRSYQRFDTLTKPVQADIRNTIGWYLNENEVNQNDTLQDDWLIIGKRQRVLYDKQPEFKLWLYGKQSQRMALIHHVGLQDTPPILPYAVGQSVNATLIFEPSQTPLRARVIQQHDTTISEIPAGQTITDAIAGFSKALSQNPWLTDYPIMLRDVYMVRFDKYWTLRHADGTYLPIAPFFKHRWITYALSSDDPVNVNALWDGRYVYPLSVMKDSNFIDLEDVMDYKPKER